MKKLLILVAVLSIIAISLGCLLVFQDTTIENLELKQDEMSIRAKWDSERTSGYKVILVNGKNKVEYESLDNSFKIPIHKVEHTYEVRVYSKPNLSVFQFFPKSAKGEIYIEKINQNIQIDQTKFYLVKGQKQELKIKSLGKLSYKSSDKKVAVVKDGEIKAKKQGKAKIKIHADGGSYFREATVTISVQVYPKVLENAKIEYAKAGKIKWDKIPYAKSYIVYEYNPHKDKYKKLGETKKRIYKVEEAKTYAVKGYRKVNGKKISSKRLIGFKVPYPSETAKKYKKAHTLDVLDRGDFKQIASVHGTGSAIVPQSFSYVNQKYVVSFSSRSGNESAFITYDNMGKQIGIKRVDISYANGSTYNPNTKKIYTVRTHMNAKSDKCTSYSLKKKKTKVFKLPGITSGIAYDEITNLYYLSKGKKLEIVDEDFNHQKTFKKVRYRQAQDIGASKGVAIVCVWTGGKNYIDLYRIKDKAYLGGFTVPFGEVESAVAVNKHLVLLFHNTDFNGTRSGKILITKKAIPLL